MSNLLYKYLDVNGATMMLYHSNLMYANATTFNDPFDCHPGLIDFSNVPPEECKGWTPKIVEDLRTNLHENHRNDLWICCLSKVYDSLLMWSYYNKHEGVCIGLNMDNVAKYIDASYGLMATARGKEVEYRDIFEKPVCRSFHGDYFDYQVFTKAKAWEHEQEVRLYVYKPSPMFFRLLPFQKDKQDFDIKEVRTFIELGPECFDSIYFGVKISPENKAEIIQYAKKLNPDIKIYQMEIDPDAFRVVEKQEMSYTLSDYIELFSNLHTKQQGKKAPYKAIMLISVIELIASRHIHSNYVEFTEKLEDSFSKNWKQYVGESLIFKPKAGIPFWHLNSEPFWQLIPFEGGYERFVELQKGNPYSPSTIRKNIKYAAMDKNLYELLQDERNQTTLRNILINSIK